MNLKEGIGSKKIHSLIRDSYTCNRFQTHKRFKRFEVYKSDVLVLLFWKQNMTLSQSDRFPPWGGKQSDWPIRLLSLLEGKRSDWFLVVTWLARNGIANSHWFLTIEWTLKVEWILIDEGRRYKSDPISENIDIPPRDFKVSTTYFKISEFWDL